MSLLYNFPVRTSFYPFCLILQDVQLLPRSDSVDEFSRASGAASNPYSSRREITEELSISCARYKFLRLIHSLHPAVVTLYEEDCDTTSTNLVCRLTNLYEHEWLPFDFLATFLQDSGGRINEQLLVNRLEYKRNVGRRIYKLKPWIHYWEVIRVIWDVVEGGLYDANHCYGWPLTEWHVRV